MKSLAVKYRPKTLDQFIGQENARHIVENILKTGNIPSSLLIDGQTGLGKTSLSRILARTLNCRKHKGCGKCESCRLFDVSPDSHPDYIEINAGSERGIDKIRDLADIARYSPVFNQRFLVLDEVHALTGQAKSSVLKPLEEPKENTTWILATTNPEKLTRTMINRCVRISLSPVEKFVLAKRIRYIAKKESFDISIKHSEKIAEYSGGFVRDALSVLERISRSGNPGSGNIDSLIDEAFSDSEEMQLAVSAAGILIGIYEKSNSVIVKSLADVKDFTGLLNKMSHMNGYLIYNIQKRIDPDISNPYFWSYEIKNLLDALDSDLKTGNGRKRIFKQAVLATGYMENFRNMIFSQVIPDPRTCAISVFCK